MIDCGTYRFDRCDRCGAKALHRAIRGEHELMLCQHHHNQYGAALGRQGWWFCGADTEWPIATKV